MHPLVPGRNLESLRPHIRRKCIMRKSVTIAFRSCMNSLQVVLTLLERQALGDLYGWPIQISRKLVCTLRTMDLEA